MVTVGPPGHGRISRGHGRISRSRSDLQVTVESPEDLQRSRSDLQVTVGSPEVTVGSPEVTVGSPEVTVGSPGQLVRGLSAALRRSGIGPSGRAATAGARAGSRRSKQGPGPSSPRSPPLSTSFGTRCTHTRRTTASRLPTMPAGSGFCVHLLRPFSFRRPNYLSCISDSHHHGSSPPLFGCARRLGAAGILPTRATQRRERRARPPLPIHLSGAGRIAARGSCPARSP